MSLKIIVKPVRICFSAFVVSLIISQFVVGQVRSLEDKDRYDALRVWESAIAAKGGRARLRSVQNLVISSVSTYKHRANTYVRRNESLFVLPDKLWIWNDQRPDVFGVTIEMCNFETRKRFFINSDRQAPIPSVVPANESALSRTYGLLSYLMETSWFDPKIETVTSGRLDNRIVNIVKTSLMNSVEGFATDYRRIDFVIDAQSHLPVEIRYYQTGPNGDSAYLTEKLLDYVDIDGIKMPSRRIVNEKTIEKLRFQLNVRLNQAFFNTPPSLSNGPDAWKEKKVGQK